MPPYLRNYFISSSLLLLAFTSFSQEVYEREFMIENDNDAYTFDIYQDQYYSQGVSIRYRQIKTLDTTHNRLEKQIRGYEFNHRIYTPRLISWSEASQMDRPYAGQVSLAASNEYYYRSNAYLKASFEIGWMGPALNTEDLQIFWHRILGMIEPNGWEFEIGNTPILNTHLTYAKSLINGQHTELISESSASLGTTRASARQELVFRVGTFNPIARSIQYNSVLGMEKSKSGEQEVYFFVSPGLEYIAYDATIEGGFFRDNSIYTETRVPLIFQIRAGIMISWARFDLGYIYYLRTKETTDAIFHKYAGLRMNYRF